MGTKTQDQGGNAPAVEPGDFEETVAATVAAENGTLSDHEILRALVVSLVQGNRRWQLVVFPSLFAFVLLAAYGFYLVYSLVEDVDKMANSVYLNMGFMSERMGQISQNLDALTGSVRDISVNLDDLTGTVTAMNVTVGDIAGQMQTLPPMLDAMREVNRRIASMDGSIQSVDGRIGHMDQALQTMTGQMAAITVATQGIGGNVYGINQSVGRPMNFMNSIMPW